MKKWDKERQNIELTYKNRWVFNWFSNMIPCDIEIDGKLYKSTENYYQAMKTTNEEDHNIIASLSPEQSKARIRKFSIREDWDDIKVNVMQSALEVKFSQPEWKERLLATSREPIVEWNNWNDKFWGVSIKDNLGKNKLGSLLMEIRQNYKLNSLF